jgi:5-methylcytosine-specific restriction endonuclease McrA
MKYADKLKDPKWQKKRLEILNDRGWACELCCDQESTLHVHHVIYLNGLDPWEYENKLLRVLCGDCHQKEHGGLILGAMVLVLRAEEGWLDEEIARVVFAFANLNGGLDK